MREEAQKTLGDLYAIRATMSLVAQNDDKAAPDRREIDKINREIDGCRRATDNEKSKARNNLRQYEIDVRIKQLETERIVVKNNLGDAHKRCEPFTNRLERKEYFPLGEKITYIVLAALGVVCGAFILGFFLPAAMKSPTLDIFYALFFPLTFGWLFLGACIMVPLTIFDYRLMKKGQKQYQAEEQKCQARLDKIDRDLEPPRKRKEEGERYVEDVVVHTELENLQKAIEGNDREIIRLKTLFPSHNEAIQAIAVQSKALVESAIKAYPVIDFRDWANVDLLIYYFETGRADSMKEALQLVDRQRQTDQITQALALASAEISRTIHQSMMQLGNALAQSFSVLSAQLAAQHNEVMQGMEEQAARQRAEIGRQTAAIERQSAMQVSAQEMNAALLNKISTSSGHLAEQMDRQMREVYHIYP